MKRSHIIVENCAAKKETTCCFSGYRPEKFASRLPVNNRKKALTIPVKALYQEHKIPSCFL